MFKDIKTNITNKAIWMITYPIMIGMLSQMLITLVDTAFLGRLGEVELGAASMAGIFYYCFTTLAWGFAIGVQIIIARRFGEKNYERISIVLRHGVVFLLGFGVVLFLGLHYLTDIFMTKFISSHAVSEVAIEFITYRKFGIFFASINVLFRSFYIGISNTKSIWQTTVLMTIINVLMDWLLIFGSPYTPALGVAGAAIASFMAEIAATIYFVVYTTVKRPVKVVLFSKFKFETELMLRTLSISFPTMCQKFISYGSWLVFFIVIEKLGERVLAVTMVCRSVYMVISVPAYAFAATANTLTSRLIGEGNDRMVRPTLLRIWKLSALSLIIPSVLVTLFPEQFLMVYTNSPEIIKDAIPILYLAAITEYAMGAGFIYFEAISGTGNTKHALISELAALGGYLFTAWFFAFGIDAGIFWVWTSDAVYGTLCLIICGTYMYKFKWQGKVV